MLKRVIRSFNYYQNLYKKYADEKNILIYQMGKVGSTSLEDSISNSIHLHTLYLDNHTCKPRQAGLFGCGWHFYINKCKQHLINLMLRKAIKSREKTKVITLFRQPLQRNISMFFHDLDAYVFNAQSNLLKSKVPALMTRQQEGNILFDIFEKQFDHSYPLNWFDKEFERLWGINIYQQPFNKDLGYSYISKGNIELLCIDMSKLNESLPEISHFVGETVKLSTKNQASAKWYGTLYSDFKKHYKPSDKIQSLITNSKMNKHFIEDD